MIRLLALISAALLFAVPAHAADPGDPCTVEAKAWEVADTDPTLRIYCDGTQWRPIEKIDESGAATHPVRMAIMNILAAGGLGYVTLRFSCLVDDIGHTCVYHLLPFVVAGAVLGLLARWLYRW